MQLVLTILFVMPRNTFDRAMLLAWQILNLDWIMQITLTPFITSWLTSRIRISLVKAYVQPLKRLFETFAIVY